MNPDLSKTYYGRKTDKHPLLSPLTEKMDNGRPSNFKTCNSSVQLPLGDAKVQHFPVWHFQVINRMKRNEERGRHDEGRTHIYFQAFPLLFPLITLSCMCCTICFSSWMPLFDLSYSFLSFLRSFLCLSDMLLSLSPLRTIKMMAAVFSSERREKSKRLHS